nr:synaptobrevin, longin-like domain protein [Tanacetum cinerariifolium]
MSYKAFLVCIWCAVTFRCLTIDARPHIAKTFDLVWMWLGGDYGNVFLMGFKWEPVVNMCINSLHGSDSEQRNHEFIYSYLASASVYVWIGYALTVKPTVYVSHIRQFWSTARIETTEEGTKILATVDGILRTVTESSLRRNLKLKDEEGIIFLPDAKLFENLTLMGYNISLNQKFTFQKGQFSHQWKYLIHTIMQCMSPKSNGFNEFSSNIATALVCLATNRVYNFSKMIFDGMVKNVNNKGEGSGTPTEPHHIPSPEAQPTSSTTPSSPTLPSVTTAPIPTVTPSDTPHLRQYTRRTRIAQSSVLPPAADEPASPLRDVSQGEACPTDSGFGADQDRANITKTSTLPHDSAPRVTSPAADEGSMQRTLDELMALCTSLQRQHSKMVSKFKAQELEINMLKERVKLLEEREGGGERSEDDAPIKGRNLDEGKAVADRVSDDTEEMATVLTSIDATTVLASGVAEVPTGSGSIPTAGSPTTKVPTGSDVVPSAGLNFATATVVTTPYTRRKGKETMVESETPKKKKIARDAEIARIHAEEELHIMIDGLDRSNETVAKYLQEYHQFATELPLERRIELISDLIRKGIRFKQESVKKLKTSEEVKTPDEVPEEKVKEMMQLVPIEEVYAEALQVKHPIIDWKALVKESLSIRQPTSDKEIELWVELKRLYEPDDEDQLWTHTHNLMHAPVEWKLYDMCGVHQVTSKDKEIFILVEKDYPLRKGLAIVMICYKLRVENYSQMANDMILKIYKIANCPSQQDNHLGFHSHNPSHHTHTLLPHIPLFRCRSGQVPATYVSHHLHTTTITTPSTSSPLPHHYHRDNHLIIIVTSTAAHHHHHHVCHTIAPRYLHSNHATIATSPSPPSHHQKGAFGFDKNPLGCVGFLAAPKGAFGCSYHHKGCVWFSSNTTKGVFGLAETPQRVRLV